MVGNRNRKNGGKKRGGDYLEASGENQTKKGRDQLNGQGSTRDQWQWRLLVRPADAVRGVGIGNLRAPRTEIPGSSRTVADEMGRVILPPTSFGLESQVPKLEVEGAAMMGEAEPQLESRKVLHLFARVMPELLDYLSQKDLLQCRLVCKQWLTSLNEVVEQRPFRAPYADEFHLKQMASQNRRPRYRNNSWRFAKINLFVPLATVTSQLEKFMVDYNRLQFSGENPFFGRSLQLNMEFTSVTRLNIHSPVVLHFLQQFGRHIWHLIIWVQKNRMPTRHLAYQNLMAYLSLMPNLRTLKIILREQEVPNLEQERQDARALADKFRNPEDLKMEQLQTLELVQPEDVPVYYTHALFRPIRQQVRKLRLRCWIPEFENLFHGLRDLDLYKVESNQQLQALTFLQAPVQKLTLKFCYSDVDVGLLNLVVQRFPLRVLKLEWNAPVKPVLGRPPRGELLNQKVHTLHTLLITHSLRVNYNFLFWFPNLKYLELTDFEDNTRPLYAPPLAKDLKKAEAWQRIQLQRPLYLDGMARSNIWILLKHLTLIYFKRVRLTSELGRMEILGERLVKWERKWITAKHWCIEN